MLNNYLICQNNKIGSGSKYSYHLRTFHNKYNMKWKYCIHLMIETTELTKQENFEHYNLPCQNAFQCLGEVLNNISFLLLV